MRNDHYNALNRFFEAVFGERKSQLEKWGETQHHRDGTGRVGDDLLAQVAIKTCNSAASRGLITWRHILAEEVAEAFAESDPLKLKAELIQVATVAAAWIEDIEQRQLAEAAAPQ